MSMNYLEKHEEQVDGYEILWDMASSLWKNLTLEEFEEALAEEGYDDYYCRVLIGLQDLEWMKKTFGGDGKGLLRKRYKQLQSGELDRVENEKIKKLKNLKNRYETFLMNQKDYSTQKKHNKEELDV